MAEFVRLDADGGVGTIRIDRPPVNALSGQVADEIADAARSAAARDDIRAVVVYGGTKVFAAGADVTEMGALGPVEMYRYIGRFHAALGALEAVPKVTIAAISGYALGGGCELALACDLRICSRRAKLGQPEVHLGVIPGAGGTQRLPRLVGIGRAKELIYSGRHVGADEAVAIGLVTEAADDVYDRAVEIAGGYAAGPALALAAAKHAIQDGAGVDLATGLALERHAFSSMFATEDQKIGFASFAEAGPGKARFVGR